VDFRVSWRRNQSNFIAFIGFCYFVVFNYFCFDDVIFIIEFIIRKLNRKFTQIKYFYIFRERIINLIPKPENQKILQIIEGVIIRTPVVCKAKKTPVQNKVESKIL
jgi:hypothetical protein